MNQSGIALPNGSNLKEYTIERELGAGTFGITYLAVDKDSNRFAIKEYLPNDIAIRQTDQTISPKSNSDKNNFYYGLESFIEEAKTLLKFDHPNIVKTNGFFEANGTVYIVMDYEEGKDLQDFLAHKNILDEDTILSIILPLLDGLRAVHEQSYLHRDIKPGNIYIRTNGIPMLIDFGASRIALGEKSKSLSVVLTDGYAPKEQYSSRSKQGTFTDLYAIGAVMYKMVTGETPIESSARSDAVTDDEPDPHPRLQDAKNLSAYGENLKKAVDWCLELKGKDRPQSARALQDLLLPNIKSTDKPKKYVYEGREVSKEEFQRLKTLDNEFINMIRVSSLTNELRNYIDKKGEEFFNLELDLQYLNKNDITYKEKEIELSKVGNEYGKLLRKKAELEKKELKSKPKQNEIKIGQVYIIKDKKYILTESGLKRPNSNYTTYNYAYSIQLLKAEGLHSHSIGTLKKPIERKVVDDEYHHETKDKESNKGKWFIFILFLSLVAIATAYYNKDETIQPLDNSPIKEWNLKMGWNPKIYKGKRSYSRNSSNTVKDNYTGLIWQKSGSSKEMNWENAKNYCNNLSLDDYQDWRLPIIEELYYLGNITTSPSIDTNYFDVKSSSYWSSTPHKNNAKDMWDVNFAIGNDGWNSKSNNLYVLCVREG